MNESYALTVSLMCRAKRLDFEKTIFIDDISDEEKEQLSDAIEKVLWDHLWHRSADSNSVRV